MLGIFQRLHSVCSSMSLSANAVGIVFNTSLAPEDQQIERRCIINCEMIRTCLHNMDRRDMKRLSMDIAKSSTGCYFLISRQLQVKRWCSTTQTQ